MISCYRTGWRGSGVESLAECAACVYQKSRVECQVLKATRMLRDMAAVHREQAVEPDQLPPSRTRSCRQPSVSYRRPVSADRSRQPKGSQQEL